MKVLLVNPPSVCRVPRMFSGISYYQWLRITTPQYWFLPGEHLGLQSIAAYILEYNPNCEVKLLNGCLEEVRDIKSFIELIDKEYPFDLVALSGPADVFIENYEIAQHIKRYYPNCKIVLGNCFATLCYNEIFQSYDSFDYLSIGAGEKCLSDLIKYLEGKVYIEEVPSIAYKIDGQIIINKQTDVVDVMNFPAPIRNDTEKVLQTGLSVSVYTARGCVYACKYCTSGSQNCRNTSQKNYILRDPVEVVDEIEILLTRFKIPRIVFVDDTFAANTIESKMHALQICEEMERRHLNIPFMIDTRIDCIDAELFIKLKAVGLERIFMGIEARDDRTLKVYNKGYQLEDEYIKEKLDILMKLGISVVYGVIPLYPAVALDELEKNIDFIFNLDTTDPFMFLKEFVPYPGTILTEQYIEEGLVRGKFPNYTVHYLDENVKRVQKYYNMILDKYFMIITLLNINGRYYIDDQYLLFIRLSREFFYRYLKALIDVAKRNKDQNEYECVLKVYIKDFRQIIDNCETDTLKNAAIFALKC